MKLAVHFGAGNIGRGFIAPILFENDYQVIFVDVDKELVNLINSEKSYRVTSINANSSDINIVSNITAIDLASTDELNTALLNADLISTSVGPKFVQGIYQKVAELDNDRNQIFVAFENMYRASSTSSNKVEKLNPNLEVIDAVVDKIVPPQITDSLSVTVEKYGSIILDEDSEGRPLKKSDVVNYKNYDNEFYKKLWLLNGLHLQLAYFAKSNNINFIHEILDKDEGVTFAKTTVSQLSTAFNLFTNQDLDHESFTNLIIERFSLSLIKDDVNRICRNPEIKFSKDERFEYPLRTLIANNSDVSSFKEILDIIFENSFSDIDGYDQFHKDHISIGREKFYKEFWELEDYSDRYIEKLGG
jgi:mannitol-1-phosphate 5-dehydrogenase